MDYDECKRRDQVEKLIHIAEKWWGKPYIYGGNSFLGVDCSGYVCAVLRSVGLITQKKDYTAQQLWLKFGGIDEFILQTPIRGALVFWFKDSVAVHVGICIDEETTIQAARGQSDITDKDMANKSNAFVDYVPVNYRDDPARFVRLF